jgi:hypothetical protein
MKLFQCQNCGHVLYFENRRCENCHCEVGYLPAQAEFVALGQTQHRLCANAAFDACNWIVSNDSDADFCLACRHNRIIPDLSIPDNLANWRLYEMAKHRLFYTLIGLGLPLRNRADDARRGLAFDFLAPTDEKPRVITGHEDGLITLNLREADDAYRARERLNLAEPYRTLLGHFRHESGHYYWDQLVADEHLERFREVFGDERRDYAAALGTYYANGPLPNWGSDFTSAYASAHPWEDFAETWAHYLHIIDTMEMAYSFGAAIRPAIQNVPELCMTAGPATQNLEGFRQIIDFSQIIDFGRIIDEWRALTTFMNSINRCMGHADLYPFVLSQSVIPKLEFIHLLVGSGRAIMERELMAA